MRPSKEYHLYLIAIIDRYSRYIVGWKLCNALDTANCVAVLGGAVFRFGHPEIVNFDRGSQSYLLKWLATIASRPIRTVVVGLSIMFLSSDFG